MRTIEQIKEEISKKEEEISALQDNIAELQKEWISLLPIRVGDKVKVTTPMETWRKELLPDIVQEGRVTSIEFDWQGVPSYNCHPFKKDGVTVSQTGRFSPSYNSTIEKI